jgi:hypothetical protein
MNDSGWTTPTRIAERVRRMWEHGELLRCLLGVDCFPIQLRLKKPNTRALSERFTEVRAWIRSLEAGSKTERGFGYEIEWSEINHRVLGANRIPLRAIVPTIDDALRLIGARREAALFADASAATLEQFPELRGWIARKPLALVEHVHVWDGILRVLTWFRVNPQPRVLLRQADIPGVDTKFIESRKRLFSELLDIVLSPSSFDASFQGARFFERRYGLVAKPVRIRFRILDDRPMCGGFSDLSVRAQEFAHTQLDIDRVFITENDANGLSFPPVARSIVIFGLGYGVESLAEADWLASKELYYWGDIDTHGFTMLDRVRRFFPNTSSLLMDRETLMAHRELWSQEAVPYIASLERLSREEASVYIDLCEGRLGRGVRLEQERIAFSYLERAIVGLVGNP